MAVPRFQAQTNGRLRRMNVAELAYFIDAHQALKDCGVRGWGPLDQESLDYARELLGVRKVEREGNAALAIRMTMCARRVAL